jgi:hypothetical protein
MNEKSIAEREILWYRQHGKYPERITQSRRREFYVIGDFSWNRNYPDKSEVIEPRMRAAGLYDEE